MGKQIKAGLIEGRDVGDACFRYDLEYLERTDAVPISVSLPLKKGLFSTEATRTFFEGLLPEGFTRKAVAQYMQEDPDNYLAILAELGRECLGAIQILPEENLADGNRTEENPADENRMDEKQKTTAAPSYQKLTRQQVQALAREGARTSAELVTKSHLSLTGASGKVGLYYDEANEDWYLPRGTAPSTHIVKQSHVRLHSIVANEQLSQMTAAELGIEVPTSFIVNTGEGHDQDVLLATKRYDRLTDETAKRAGCLKIPYRLHQEDFAQALGINSFYKYEKQDRGAQGYLAKMFELVRNVSANPLEDQLKLWDRIIYCFLLGNTDSHIKNFSLLYNKEVKGIRLSPAYDMVSTVVYETSSRDMAFYIGHELAIEEINRNSFRQAAEYCRINPDLALRHLDRLSDGFEKALNTSCLKLKDQGIPFVENIKEKILSEGGCRKL